MAPEPPRLDVDRHPVDVARALLGWTVACRGVAAVIVETEAYHQDEPACHGHRGRPTARTRDLFGPAGVAYVHRSHGIHLCLNVVTGAAGSGEAVLLRAAVPVAGLPLVRARRTRPGARPPAERDLLAGPGRLAQGLGVRLGDGGIDLLRPDGDDADGPLLRADPTDARAVGVAPGPPSAGVLVGPRIGITRAADLPWRFGLRGVRCSRPFGAGGS